MQKPSFYKLVLKLEKDNVIFHTTTKYVQGAYQAEYIRNQLLDAAYLLGLGKEISVEHEELPIEPVI